MLNKLISFFPLIWSNEPWETPIIKIKSKHKIDEISKLLNLISKIQKIFVTKKKIDRLISIMGV